MAQDKKVRVFVVFDNDKLLRYHEKENINLENFTDNWCIVIISLGEVF